MSLSNWEEGFFLTNKVYFSIAPSFCYYVCLRNEFKFLNLSIFICCKFSAIVGCATGGLCFKAWNSDFNDFLGFCWIVAGRLLSLL